jgi:hypothetical protein
MRSIVLFLLFLGTIFISVGYVKTNMKCPPPLVKYKYLPMSFEQEQNNIEPVSKIFSKMFTSLEPSKRNIGF